MNLASVRSPLFLLLSIVCVVAAARPVDAQCQPRWRPGEPLPHVSGSIDATVVWDPDGAGPAASVLVVAGELSVGAMLSTGVAAFDGTEWTALGTAPSARVTAMTVHNAQPVAAFVGPGPNPTSTVAAWDGSTWQGMGTVGGFVFTMAAFNGELVIGGDFGSVGSLATTNIARWNGASWSSLGVGVTGQVWALAVYANALWVGGDLRSAGGTLVSYLAVWNGASWSPPLAGSPNAAVRALAVRSGTSALNSYLFAGGSFTSVGAVGANHIARYNSGTSSWTALGAGLPGAACTALVVRSIRLTSYELVAGIDDPGDDQRVWLWSGGAWTAMNRIGEPPGAPFPAALAWFGGQYVCGLRSSAQAVRAFDGSAWRSVAGPGISDDVYAVRAVGADVVLGGVFQAISGVTMNGIARGRPGAWSPLGSGFGVSGRLFAPVVMTLAIADNGDVIAGGAFDTAGGQSANNIARWDGSSWSPLGTGTDSIVNALAVLPDGDLIAVGAFRVAGGRNVNGVARWDGSSWSPLGAGVDASAYSVVALPGGEIVVGGYFATAGGVPVSNIARWNGTAWSALGSGVDGAVFALAAMPDGDVVCGGILLHAGAVSAPRIARWNGNSWSAVDTPQQRLGGVVHSLCVLPDGDLVAGGFPFTLGGPTAVTTLARLHGTSWTSMDVAGRVVTDLAFTAAGDLLVAGAFRSAGGAASGNFARRTTPCPATVVAYGSGCAGSAGRLSLTSAGLPWIGGCYRAVVSGLAPGALAVDLLGFDTAAIPLSLLHPAGGVGCSLLVDVVATTTLVPTNGTATVALDVPRDPALVGAVLRDQVLQVEFGPASAITALGSTNGLSIRLGAF